MRVTYKGEPIRIYENGGETDSDKEVFRRLKQECPDLRHEFGVIVESTRELVFVRLQELEFEEENKI